MAVVTVQQWAPSCHHHELTTVKASVSQIQFSHQVVSQVPSHVSQLRAQIRLDLRKYHLG